MYVILSLNLLKLLILKFNFLDPFQYNYKFFHIFTNDLILNLNKSSSKYMKQSYIHLN